MYYTGIGSRSTPKVIQEMFENIATELSARGYILRSGGAKGADSAFERGCIGEKEIFLPWKGFEDSESELIVNDKRAFEIAKNFHFNWHKLTQGTRKLHARNVHQVLGVDLETPSKFVICYTRNGEGGGGTGQALRIAEKYKIPIFDMGIKGRKYEDLIKFIEGMEKLC